MPSDSFRNGNNRGITERDAGNSYKEMKFMLDYT